MAADAPLLAEGEAALAEVVELRVAGRTWVFPAAPALARAQLLRKLGRLTSAAHLVVDASPHLLSAVCSALALGSPEACLSARDYLGAPLASLEARVLLESTCEDLVARLRAGPPVALCASGVDQAPHRAFLETVPEELLQAGLYVAAVSPSSPPATRVSRAARALSAEDTEATLRVLERTRTETLPPVCGEELVTKQTTVAFLLAGSLASAHRLLERLPELGTLFSASTRLALWRRALTTLYALEWSPQSAHVEELAVPWEAARGLRRLIGSGGCLDCVHVSRSADLWLLWGASSPLAPEHRQLPAEADVRPSAVLRVPWLARLRFDGPLYLTGSLLQECLMAPSVEDRGVVGDVDLFTTEPDAAEALRDAVEAAMGVEAALGETVVREDRSEHHWVLRSSAVGHRCAGTADVFYCALERVRTFHLPCCRCALDWASGRLLVLPSCVWALASGINIDYRFPAGSKGLLEVLARKHAAGFALVVNERERWRLAELMRSRVVALDRGAQALHELEAWFTGSFEAVLPEAAAHRAQGQ